MADIREIFGSEYPMNVGGMAHIGTAELGIPTLKAGLGFVMTMIRADTDRDSWTREQFSILKEATNRPFGLNILFTDNPRVDKDIELALNLKPRFVTLSAVLRPRAEKVNLFKESKIYVGFLVGSKRFAEWCVDAGADFLILEGNESGGHNGPNSTDYLVKEVLPWAKERGIPVTVAGGIATRERAKGIFNLGADGIQIGTFTAASKESPANEGYKAKVLESTETVVTGARWRHAVRALKSPFTEKLLEMENNRNITWDEFSDFAKGSIPAALLSGDWENGTFLAGVCCKDIHESKSIVEIRNELLGLNE